MIDEEQVPEIEIDDINHSDKSGHGYSITMKDTFVFHYINDYSPDEKAAAQNLTDWLKEGNHFRNSYYENYHPNGRVLYLTIYGVSTGTYTIFYRKDYMDYWPSHYSAIVTVGVQSVPPYLEKLYLYDITNENVHLYHCIGFGEKPVFSVTTSFPDDEWNTPGVTVLSANQGNIYEAVAVVNYRAINRYGIIGSVSCTISIDKESSSISDISWEITHSGHYRYSNDLGYGAYIYIPVSIVLFAFAFAIFSFIACKRASVCCRD